ncbi:MAG: hypothetical protein H0U73_09995 [Tatlockia sp.]|nr:hypothetical protein [Tatlockia sp.]
MARQKIEMMLKNNPKLIGLIKGLKQGLEDTKERNDVNLKGVDLNQFTIEELQLVFCSRGSLPTTKNHIDFSGNNLYKKTDSELEKFLNTLPENIVGVTIGNLGDRNLKIREGLKVITKPASTLNIPYAFLYNRSIDDPVPASTSSPSNIQP